MPTVNYQVSATGDDGTEAIAITTWVSSQTAIGRVDSVGYGLLATVTRFLNVAVPKGATIDSATYTITEKNKAGGTFTTYTKVRAQAVDDAAAPSSTNKPSGMSFTSAGVDLDINSSDWVADQETAVTITAVIQEIVNRAGWASGNDINIVIVDDGTTAGDKNLGFYDYAESTSKAAKLSITYSTVTASQMIIFTHLLSGGR